MESRELKVGIIGGLISSLIVLLFIQPILSLLWKAVLATGGFLHRGYIDRIYRGASSLSSNPYGETTLMVVGMVGLFVALFWMLGVMEKVEQSHPPHRYSRFLLAVNFISVTMVFLTPPIVFVRVAILRGRVDIAESFNQRLTVLAPAISDNEYKVLKARWASMQGEADYKAIVSSMDKRATDLGVTLPPASKP